MLRFFRHNRQNLFQQGKVSRYLGYAIGEIILIMVGIILALQLNNWNEGRKDRNTELEMLTNLQKEFIGNQEMLEGTIGNFRSIIEELNELRLLIHDNLKSIEPAKFNSLLDSVSLSTVYYPADGVIQSIIESSNLSLISNEELKYLITQWPPIIGSYLKREENRANQTFNYVRPYIRKRYPTKNYIALRHPDDSIGNSKHQADIELMRSDLEFENIVEAARGISRNLLGNLESLKEYQTELLEMLDEELDEN